ncbi:hypothetical protein AVEN_62187-1 [Araneus ventricosus]|uniref:Histone-lysine N-methyltransferase SETMAR n=1 Tax=Araneus ventricosus TaxID=182803 RepID=A0A4Y2K9C7_ARAVE|nr:hypothetical protein AVEN_62187-1 [Araneus ventricosus]
MAVLKAKIEEKRPELTNSRGVVFRNYSAGPHIAMDVRQRFTEYGWDVLCHPSYSLDLALSDFHHFGSLRNSLSGLEFTSLETLKQRLGNFFTNKSNDFFRKEIYSYQKDDKRS